LSLQEIHPTPPIFSALQPDRFSREGVLPTLKHLELLTSYGVAWKSFTEQYFDSCGIFRDAVISIAATLAKQERLKISERTVAGLERARKAGAGWRPAEAGARSGPGAPSAERR
jgi:DNA invertase Pin-like site-specific DNA recombinase